MNWRQFSDKLIKVGAFIIILEPFWMLLPFAGFLYGSLCNLEFLKDNHFTIGLLYFVFPVQTLMPLAIVLSITGILIFLVGALQIYTAKSRKSGMVKTGVYSKLRHPQYTGLTVFCIGILLTWGRLISFFAFFLMLFLYYFLARKEEKICLKQFGKDYRDYMKTSYFLFPGDRIFSFFGTCFAAFIPNRSINMAVSLLLLMAIGIGSCIMVISIRLNSMQGIDFSQIEMSLTYSQTSKRDLDLIFIKGFFHHLMPSSETESERSLDRALHAFAESKRLKNTLKKDGLEEANALLCFLLARTVQEKKPYYGEGKGDIFVIFLNSPKPLDRNNFSAYRNDWKILGATSVNKFDVQEIVKGGEPVQGKIIPFEPFDDEADTNFHKRIEGILNIYLTGLKKDILPINRVFENT
jgi:protein-S-isoprenylcysteine O-methyltransferase Ste14